ncbi:hypothetical protein ABZP36_026818 [Zizania latifolia]
MAANPSSPSAAGGDASASSPTLPPVRLAGAQAAAAAAPAIHPSSPRFFFSSLAGTNASPHRRIAIAVDLSDESAYAGGKGRLGSVSDYCVHHCVCPVVVVRYPDDAAGADGEAAGTTDELHTVPEDEPVYHDAPEVHKGLPFYIDQSNRY